MVKAADRFLRRRRRVRYALKDTGNGRLRLSVFRSGRHIYGQVIDDDRGATLAFAAWGCSWPNGPKRPVSRP